MNIVQEQWRDIPETPGYQASSLGRIRSLDRIVEQAGRWGGIVRRAFPGRILAASPSLKGYLHVSVGSPAKTTAVAKLVAAAFLGTKPERLEINHKDGDKTNNSPDNLEYATATENNHHAINTGLRKIKVSREQIEEMKLLSGYVPLRGIARRYGVHHSYVRHLLGGKRKVAV